jgi:hypothetical protein
MKMKKIAMMLLGALMSMSGHAQDKPKAEFNLVLETKTAYRWSSESFQKWEWILKPELDYKLSKKVRLFVSGRLYTDLTDNLEMGKPQVDESSSASQRHFIGDKAEWEFRDVYLDLDLDELGFVRVGKQQIVWGETDGLKLLDVVNPQYFREFVLADFDASRIPLWSVKHDFSIEALNVQLVWIPDNTYHDLPKVSDPFFPKSNLPTFGDHSVLLNRTEKPTRFFRDSEYGVKLNKFMNGWDVSLNYLYTYDDFSIFNIQSLAGHPTYDVSVTPYYSRYHLVGGSFNKAINAVTLRGELAVNVNKEFGTLSSTGNAINATKNQTAAALGIDWLPGENMFSAQVFVDKVFDVESLYGRKSFDSFITLLYRRDLFNDSMTLEFQEIHNVSRAEGLVRLSANYFLLSNLEVLGGTDVFYGKNNRLFGQFSQQNRITIGLRWGI